MKDNEYLENLILAAFLRDNHFSSVYLSAATQDMFSTSTNKTILQVLKMYVSQYNKLPSSDTMYSSLSTYCNQRGIDAQVKQLSIDHLGKLYDLVYDNKYTEDTFKKVATYNSLVSAIISSAKTLQEKGDSLTENDYDMILSRITKSIDIKSRSKTGILLDDVADHIAEYIEENSRYDKQGLVKTGIPSLDESFISGGMIPQELHVYSCPPGLGKTTMLVNMSANTILRNQDVIFIALGDNTEEDILLRIIANITRTPALKVMMGSIDYKERWNKIKGIYPMGKFVVTSYPIGSASISDIRSFITSACVKYDMNPKMVVIDYIDNLFTRTDVGSYYELGRLYTECKQLAEELNLVVLSASQSKVGNWSSGEKVGMGELAGSSAKAHVADFIGTIYDSFTNGEKQTFLYIAKSRRGKSGIEIPIVFDMDTQSVREAPSQKTFSQNIGVGDMFRKMEEGEVNE